MALFYPGKTLKFNGYDLTSIPGFMVTEIDVGQLPKRILETYLLSRAHGEAVVSAFFDYREIVVKASFVCRLQSDFEVARDLLMKNITAASGSLVVTIAGSDRSFTCTLSDNTAFSDYAGGYAAVELHFNAYDPFGYDTGLSSLLTTTVTTSGPMFNVTAGGTVRTQTPIYTITINSFTGSSAGFPIITVTNASTGDNATFQTAAVAHDVIVMDSQTGKMMQNNTEVAYSGVIPKLSPDTSLISISDACTARNFSLSIVSIKRYV